MSTKMSTSHRHVDVSQMPFGHNADVNPWDNMGRVPSHEASGHSSPIGDHPNVVRLVPGHCADVNARDGKARTPLHAASFHGRTEVVRQLLQRGANADAQDKDG